ncbi:MAG: TM2 domain-containing protein [Acetomicrobium flavidum]|mgnify:CR=1 FL=1|uniref:TM2 domain-containing protein n=1 Tax=Acetomicrobium flavidum TaxID=49896 RepID=UPI00169E0DD2|nr:TM2 domain-containing protein [Acetomicrobium flavidum]
MSQEGKEQLSQQQFFILESEMQKRRKSLPLTYVLLIFLGALGVHKFYLGKTKQGLLYLVLGVVGFISLLIGEFTGLISFGASGNLLFRFGLVCLGILVILLIVDLFTIPRQVRQANMAAENKIIDQLLNAPTGSNPV